MLQIYSRGVITIKKQFLILIAIFIIASLAMSVTAKTAQETFMLFLEAEDCTLNGYTIVDGNKGAVGKMITSTVNNEDTFTVSFEVPADGQYVLWMKVWHLSQVDNSIKYNYNGSELVYDFDEFAGTDDPTYSMYGTWYWMYINERGTEPLANGWSEWGEANSSCRHTPVYLDLKKGANSIEFIARESGHFIDQIIITDDVTYDPGNVPGNKTYVCAFCNLEHYLNEPFQDFGKTPEQFWNEKIAAEIAASAPQTEAPAEAEAAAEVPEAPAATVTAAQTADIISVSVTAVMLAAAVWFITKKK
ncbi:MAG: carbohydrate-binding protein [Eubacteriales bacterium]